MSQEASRVSLFPTLTVPSNNDESKDSGER